MQSFNQRFSHGALVSILLLTATMAHSTAFKKSNTAPYFGVDTQIRHINWDEEFGGNIFKKDYLQGKLFGGFRFTEYFGIEGGYQITVPRIARNFLGSNNLLLGVPITLFSNNPPLATEGKFALSGWYTALTGFIPITRFNHLFASVGAAYLKASHRMVILGDFRAAQSIASSTRNFAHKRFALRLGVGAMHMFSEYVGIRATLDWEKTSRFKNLKATAPTPVRITLKDSWSYGLGVFTQF